jgi:uncharacterized protein (TIGR04141 family)
MSRDVSPAEFGIDIEQDLVSSVTARSRDPLFGKLITGKDALQVTAKVDITNVIAFLQHCLVRYESSDYKTHFDWIDQIAEVRNKALEIALNEEAVHKINANEIEKIWMAVPDVVDWADIHGFRYLKAKRAMLHDDLDIATFRAECGATNFTTDSLKQSFIFAISTRDDAPRAKWTAHKCLYAELEYQNKVYILNNGKWYQIANDFSEQISNDFATIGDASIAFPDYVSGTELQYNEEASNRLQQSFCMDQKLIPHGGGRSKFEFCDIFTPNKELIHVKKYGGSSVLSHLFSQGMASAELFAGDPAFRRKVNKLLPRNLKVANPVVRPNIVEYAVVFAIISNSPKPLDIPFFSKVSLRTARKRLMNYGYKVAKAKIQKVEVLQR